MKLLCDPVPSTSGKYVLLEGKIQQDGANKSRQIKLIGPNIVCDVENVNGRIYPLEMMKVAVDRYVKEWVNTNRGLGELEHPTRQYVDPKESCDRLISLVQDPENPHIFIGESIVMASDPVNGIHGTPQGDILAGILAHGGAVGRSTRGGGDYDKFTKRVFDDYTLVCIDTVIDPSAPGCYPKCIVEGVLQNREFMLNEHGVLVEAAYNNLKNNLKTLPLKAREAYIAGRIREFLQEIKH